MLTTKGKEFTKKLGWTYKAISYHLLWPNESSVTARRNLDTLLSRLRAMMKPLLSPEKIQNYLKVSRGIVLLQN